MEKDFDVDIVIPWVDGSDKNWLEQKNRFLPKDKVIDIDAEQVRYRDWDNVKYIFRGIQKFAPWVRKVFFITCGQVPNWLNLGCEKLVFVKHEDYIPKQYLPTFSANPIELNMHRIKGLSEHFIYMNDDLFFTKKVSKSDFFTKRGLPKISALERPYSITNNSFVFYNILVNNTRQIASKFNKKQVKHSRKWYPLTKPTIAIINLFFNFIAKNNWIGFYHDHLPSPFLKSCIEECWQTFGEVLDQTSKNKFRSDKDVNQFLFSDYQLCTNKFSAINIKKKGKYLGLDNNEENLNNICNQIRTGKYKMICINDVEIDNFEKTRDKINQALDDLLPEKSDFEK